MSIVNISAYKFVHLEKVKTLQVLLKAKGLACHLKGTILLGNEGINLSIAGGALAIAEFKAFLATFTEFEALPYKESISQELPFSKWIVSIKPEIVTIKDLELDPVKTPGAYIEAKELKRLLDEKAEDVLLLDTRNQFEAEFGTFADATVLPINKFSEFPRALDQLGESAKEKTIVTFCTGGIRCEKAVLAMHKKGFKKVFQLSGGILKYFEECGDAHYRGDCFVFDDRVAVNAQLQETGALQCKCCFMPIARNAVRCAKGCEDDGLKSASGM